MQLAERIIDNITRQLSSQPGDSQNEAVLQSVAQTLFEELELDSLEGNSKLGQISPEFLTSLTTYITELFTQMQLPHLAATVLEKVTQKMSAELRSQAVIADAERQFAQAVIATFRNAAALIDDEVMTQEEVITNMANGFATFGTTSVGVMSHHIENILRNGKLIK